nr:immunoglobulin light chain junction region [Macaca mulatta]MOX13463.1 immunoglobulin light chain junction region [Macaca mulatta]
DYYCQSTDNSLTTQLF